MLYNYYNYRNDRVLSHVCAFLLFIIFIIDASFCGASRRSKLNRVNRCISIRRMRAGKCAILTSPPRNSLDRLFYTPPQNYILTRLGLERSTGSTGKSMELRGLGNKINLTRTTDRQKALHPARYAAHLRRADFGVSRTHLASTYYHRCHLHRHYFSQLPIK